MDICLIIYSVLNAGAENSHWSYLYVNLLQRWANPGCFCGLTIKIISRWFFHERNLFSVKDLVALLVSQKIYTVM